MNYEQVLYILVRFYDSIRFQKDKDLSFEDINGWLDKFLIDPIGMEEIKELIDSYFEEDEEK